MRNIREGLLCIFFVCMRKALLSLEGLKAQRRISLYGVPIQACARRCCRACLSTMDRWRGDVKETLEFTQLPFYLGCYEKYTPHIVNILSFCADCVWRPRSLLVEPLQCQDTSRAEGFAFSFTKMISLLTT